MRLPIVPFLIAATILAVVVYLFNASGGPDTRALDAPRLGRLADIEGAETEVAVAPDGIHCAVIADGDLWLLNLQDNGRHRVSETPEKEFFPAWSADGRRLTVSRNSDTIAFTADGEPEGTEPFKSDATYLSWSSSGRIAYVRNRALWITDIAGRNEKQIFAADENPNVTLHHPRFSSDSLHLAFIKSLYNLSGQVWMVDSLKGEPRQLVADRSIENPFDVGWILDGNELAYLTDRSGGYSIWHINFHDNTILPLTQPLMDLPLAPIGMSVWKDRIVLPRHLLDSNIVLSDGTPVVHSEQVEIEPAASPDGRLIAYTVVKDNQSNIWTAGLDGSKPTLRANGHEPRFAADGFHIVYTHADLSGNPDIWRLDTRNGESERITDADEIDMQPDASRDGRWIAFTSTRGIAPSIWIIPASGGKRLRIGEGGIGPRISPDNKSILYWNKGSFWTIGMDGSGIRQLSALMSPTPMVGGWLKSAPLAALGNEIHTDAGAVVFKSEKPFWPTFDTLSDGRFLISTIDIQETALWAIDLQFKQK